MKKIKIGSMVKWTCKPYQRAEFECEGLVTGFKKSSFGGKRGQTLGAHIWVRTPHYREVYRKDKAFISTKNLSLSLIK